MVTTISENFYRAYLPHLPLHQISSLLEVHGAGGAKLPYLGYVEATIAIPPDFMGQVVEVPALILVVPTTDFTSKVPLILGTNVLRAACESNPGDRVSGSSSPWTMAFQWLSRRWNDLNQTENVRTTKSITIPPSCNQIITGICRGSAPQIGMEFCATQSVLPGSLTLVTGVVGFQSTHSTTRVKVEVANPSTKAVTIPAKTVLCHLEQVAVLDGLSPEDGVSNTGSVPTKLPKELFELDSLGDNHTPDERTQLRSLLNEFDDVFSKSDMDMGHTDLVTHRIELTDETPFKERHRRIPPSMYQEVKDHIKQMLDAKVIRPSASPYASPVVLVRKHDLSLRFCIDYRKLNSRTIRDSYALPRIEETLDTITGKILLLS
ncbi:uncharacterized protein LOC125378965 [Haliotis rufescens]|uniref:uncharacterized protein LOC125378965 n=1 Tax=Haliotis rufescens TaxID=6454 RepID=UPI00201EE387|nr:uncharacterized protein LOC125378965 [Haliotis rufescens]